MRGVASALLGATLGAALATTTRAEPNAARTATVFIRVVGDVRVEVDRGWKQIIEKPDVEIGTGSGFLVSPTGPVVTNHHVVTGEDLTVTIEGQPVRVNLVVKRIDVLLPEAGAGSGRRFTAAVDAASPELDLALLSVTGADLPFLPLGDSDALEPGQPVEALGYPMGRAVEVARSLAVDAAPEVTLSRGTVTALRSGDQGDRRFVQTDAVINPGNSGGPLLDAEGYVVGVVRMKLRQASGLGFAIPVNQVKDFLEASGQEPVFPGRRLRLGPLHALPGKGLRLRMPEGWDDSSPARLRVKAGAPPEGPDFLVDRGATPRSLAELEASLRSGHGFPEFAGGEAGRSQAIDLSGLPGLMGSVAGSAPREGQPLRMEYAILDLGREKLVARYVGPPALVAFNRSVIRDSLRSLEADPLLTAELRSAPRVALEPAAFPQPGSPAFVLPAGWTREATPPRRCRSLGRPDAFLAGSPEGDFTVALRAAWWRQGAIPGASCSWTAGSRGASSYALPGERMGAPLSTEGTFVARDGGLWQLEVEAPPGKLPYVADLFRAWIDTLSR